MSGETVLIVDDEQDAHSLLTKVLLKEGFKPFSVFSGEAAVLEIKKKRYSIVLLDYQLPGKNGLETLASILEEDPECRVIMITSHASIKLAVEAVRKGAHHFIEKPFDLDDLRMAMQNATYGYRVTRENVRLKEMLRDHSEMNFIRGSNPQMLALWKMVEKVAPSDTTVLLEGESGTGKEVFARQLHALSSRKNEPWVAINCGGLVEELVESELFGHVRGAFTGAIANKKGRFDMADRGTLFLDEIGEIPLSLQAKLLRVLQDKTFERVGDSLARQVDVRIIAATNRNLSQAIQEKKFREDLYYRLNVVNLKIPPLRERREDIPDLIAFFVGQFAANQSKGPIEISPEAMHILKQYDYPGNIREMKNLLERACLLCSNRQIHPEDIVPSLQHSRPALLKSQEHVGQEMNETKEEVTLTEARGQFEINYLTRLMSRTKGNLSQAARFAGIDRNNLKDKLRKYGLAMDKD